MISLTWTKASPATNKGEPMKTTDLSPVMLKRLFNPELRGFYYQPGNSDGLVTLSRNQRVDVAVLIGYYYIQLLITAQAPGWVEDLDIYLKVNKVPTHVRCEITLKAYACEQIERIIKESVRHHHPPFNSGHFKRSLHE